MALLKKQDDTPEQQVATKATKLELRTEDIGEIQIQILDAYNFDLDKVVQQKLTTLKNNRKILVDKNLKVDSVETYNLLPVKPQRFLLKRAHFDSDFDFLNCIIQFTVNGITPINRDEFIQSGVSWTGKPEQAVNVYMQSPEGVYSNDDELLKIATEQAENEAEEAREAFFTVDNISTLSNQQLAQNKQFNDAIRAKQSLEQAEKNLADLVTKAKGVK
jgi:hypothetical protein